jgi:hypothetical protein
MKRIFLLFDGLLFGLVERKRILFSMQDGIHFWLDAHGRSALCSGRIVVLLEYAAEMVEEAVQIDCPTQTIDDKEERFCLCIIFYFYDDYTAHDSSAYNHNREIGW